ncbi:hypothetical protein [Kozakia baliensis]|uniref:Uncharacterized protein n=1 Tax=Kozakia baliensis TaxID=153496 RepID=A0A1D8UR40_9PROT|nr:hypothetical protein [Kozakia baliensis]AOX16098.1 hypothetical protein A0U89_01950 [Kozakia baliensis]GBR27940.1 hypothetical protein AA0488_1282 [Kozakia baliensis NRIC 0488]GEL65427.1 hypothetical protein KBA01_27130 [Kozakia baliensis]
MEKTPFACRVAASGSFGSLTATAALLGLAKIAGKSPWQAINTTSHWAWGEEAAEVPRADLAHTALGYGTNHAATLFWALFYEKALGKGPVSPACALAVAIGTSAVAAIVDYRFTPKRFTPGWEFVLDKRAMTAVYAAMALGMAGGTLWARKE